MRYASPALVTLTALLAVSGIAFAEETSQTADSAPAPAATVKEKRAGLKSAILNVGSTFKQGIRNVRTETKEKMQAASTSAERRAIQKNAIQETKALIGARKASTTEIVAQKKELARKKVVQIEKRYVVLIKQFDNLLSRIQSRITKMKAAGADTTKAETAFALAKTAVEQVRADAQAVADLRAQAAAGEGTDLRAQVEAAVKKVNASTKAAHNALDKAGKALIVIDRLKQKKSSSTTDSQPFVSTELSASSDSSASAETSTDTSAVQTGN